MISGLALVLTFALVTFQRHVVRRTGSVAIGADMAHYGTDLVATLVTGVGLFLSGLLDQPLIDSGIAGLVALWLLRGAWAALRRRAGELERAGLPARRWLDALRGQQGRFAEFAI